MVDIERETDIERLRQVARLLDRENARLHGRLVELTRLLAEARGEVAVQLQLEIDLLQQTLAVRNQALFGRSSEKRAPAPEKTNGKPPATPRRGHGPTAQPSLPVVEEVHQLDEPDRVCPQCGGMLAEWADQFEEAEEIDVVERALLDPGHEILLILVKIAGLSSTTAKAILLLRAADRGMSAQDLDQALTTFGRLNPETARRVLDFYNSRRKGPAQDLGMAAQA